MYDFLEFYVSKSRGIREYLYLKLELTYLCLYKVLRKRKFWL